MSRDDGLSVDKGTPEPVRDTEESPIRARPHRAAVLGLFSLLRVKPHSKGNSTHGLVMIWELTVEVRDILRR